MLAEASQSGRLVGKTELTIVLTGILIDNQIKPISSTAVSAVSSQSTGADTVRRTGSAALIGGAFSGSKGAKRGAAIGCVPERLLCGRA